MKMPLGDKFGNAQGIEQKNKADVNFIEEVYFVPDKKVGLVIGLGGRNIIKLQTETGCRIKWAPKNSGISYRLFTLAGTRQSVEAAKSAMDQTINGYNVQFYSGKVPYVTEMMIPGLKVALLIGRGGENLKNLQEKAGVKMVIVQDEPQQTTHKKLLKISGDPENVQFAELMVKDFLAEIDTISVPSDKCGQVIGKGGKNIRDIEQQSGAQIQKAKGYSPDPDEEIFIIRGDPKQIRNARTLIELKIYDEDKIWSSLPSCTYEYSPNLQRDTAQGNSYFMVIIFCFIILSYLGSLIPKF